MSVLSAAWSEVLASVDASGWDDDPWCRFRDVLGERLRSYEAGRVPMSDFELLFEFQHDLAVQATGLENPDLAAHLAVELDRAVVQALPDGPVTDRDFDVELVSELLVGARAGRGMPDVLCNRIVESVDGVRVDWEARGVPIASVWALITLYPMLESSTWDRTTGRSTEHDRVERLVQQLRRALGLERRTQRGRG